ncbi:response regulator [Candidatus Woesearchaeota archaeon]|nr:response regulator [Candidatus Woesearchaeota archaeon]
MPKILVVEDDPLWKKIFQQYLIGLQGIVNAVSNSDDAVSKIEESIRLNEPYDAYILDTMFPKKPGALPAYEAPFELIEEMRGKGIQSERIFMIGHMDPVFMQKAKGMGIKKFYFKEKERKLEGQKHYTQIRADLAAILR